MRSILAATLAVASVLGTAAAQTIADQATAPAAIPPPSAGLLLSYQYWPTQYIQWIAGPELPYAMIEFDVNTATKQPLYHAVLTGKDGTRTHYSNVEPMAAAYKRTGEASYKTDIAYDTDDTGKPGSTSTIRFTMQDGKPFEWRFVQGSDISQQGAGLTPLPDAPVPVFAYREEGAVAGEGTAVKIGDAVSTAEVWKEISHPPYFVAYRGAITSGAHMLVFTRGAETWKIAKAPATVAAGSAWELDGNSGDHRTLTVSKMDGTHALIAVTDKFHPLINVTMDATYTPTGWTVEKVRYSPLKDGEKHYVTISLATTTPATGTMDLTAGKKTALATASVEMGGDSKDRTEALKFTAPKWAAGKTVDTDVTTTADTQTVTEK